MTPDTSPQRRRSSAPSGDEEFGDVFDNGLLRVEHDNYYVSLGGQVLKLARKEFLVLSRLAQGAERIVASEELWRHAWGLRAPFNAESMHVHIYRLRRKLAPHGLQIETMVNVGYRLVSTKRTEERRAE